MLTALLSLLTLTQLSFDFVSKLFETRTRVDFIEHFL